MDKYLKQWQLTANCSQHWAILSSGDCLEENVPNNTCRSFHLHLSAEWRKIKETKKRGEDSSNCRWRWIWQRKRKWQRKKRNKKRQVISMMEHLYGAIGIRVHRMFGSVPSLVIMSATSKGRELSGVVMPRDTPLSRWCPSYWYCTAFTQWMARTKSELRLQFYIGLPSDMRRTRNSFH